ncbi:MULTISPECIES: hypothetical protein [unclassified Caballeronia]
MPKYAPGPNVIERTWRDLKQRCLANRTFRYVEYLGSQCTSAIA